MLGVCEEDRRNDFMISGERELLFLNIVIKRLFDRSSGPFLQFHPKPRPQNIQHNDVRIGAWSVGWVLMNRVRFFPCAWQRDQIFFFLSKQIIKKKKKHL